MVATTEVTKEWLAGVLETGGYDVSPARSASDAFVAKSSGRPNLIVRVRPMERIISFTHAWGLKKPGWGEEKSLHEAFNKANGNSWYSTFSRDSGGDLIVSSYLFLTASMAEGDVLAFVEKEAHHFLQVVQAAGLGKWIA